MEIDKKYRDILRESLSENLYKISLELSNLKGMAMTDRRILLTQKQKMIEELLDHIIV